MNQPNPNGARFHFYLGKQAIIFLSVKISSFFFFFNGECRNFCYKNYERSKLIKMEWMS